MYEPNTVVTYTDMTGSPKFGVVVRVDDDEVLGEASEAPKRVWCHWMSDGSNQVKGTWRSDPTWVGLEMARAVEGPEADEIFADYAAWRLTQ